MSAQRNWIDRFKLTFDGFLMGIADVIPGVSGGTIAFLLGIYEELIFAIRSIDKNFLARILKGRFKEAFQHLSWEFLLFLFLGIASAVLLFSKVMTYLLAHHTAQVHGAFFGLILATVPIIGRIIKQWNGAIIALFLISSIAMFKFVELIPLQTPETLWFIFISGSLAICAMILPGISGAFILVLLGKYQFMLEAIHQREWIIIGVFLFGMAVGILSFVRFLGWLFKRYHDATLACLTGIVLGSLNKVWPWKETVSRIVTEKGKIIPIEQVNFLPSSLNADVLGIIGLMIAGFVCALLLNRSQSDLSFFSKEDHGA